MLTKSMRDCEGTRQNRHDLGTGHRKVRTPVIQRSSVRLKSKPWTHERQVQIRPVHMPRLDRVSN